MTQVGLRSFSDIALLEWAAQEDRTILTHDVSPMTLYAYELLKLGKPMAGVIVVPSELGIGLALKDLELVLECLSQDHIRNHVQYLPL